MRVLCVCLGNICRSPTAEAVLRAHAPANWVIDSAGTGHWHIGDPPHPPAVAAGAERGYDLTALSARQFSPADFESFDLILGMDDQNIADIERLRPPGNATPVRLFLAFGAGLPDVQVPDPYYTGDFEHALDLIEAGARGLIAEYSE